jgi:hypothetical protein
MDNLDSVVVAFLTDGRKEYLEETLRSWEKHSDILKSKNRIIFDDSGDDEYRKYLKETYTDYLIVPIGEERVGFNCAIHFGHQYIKSMNCSHTVWIEDDQMLLRKIDILDMIRVLDKNNLLQLSLIREPFFYGELPYKTIFDYLIGIGWPLQENDEYIGHEVAFMTLPHIFPNKILDVKWQQDDDMANSELNYAKKLFSLFPKKDPTCMRLGYYGKINSEPHSRHIGKYGNGTVKYYWGEDE